MAGLLDVHQAKEKESLVTPPETDTTVQPGCTLAAYAEARKLPVEFLRDLSLTDTSYPRGGNNPAVRIPYIDENGKEQAALFRVALQLTKKGPCFRWPKNAKPLLYGVWHRDLETDSIVIAEGVSNCHILWYHEYNAVGLPRTSFNDDRDASYLEPYECLYVLVEPGTSGEAVISQVRKSVIRHRVRLVRLDGFKDPSALHIDEPDNFKERFDAALAIAQPWHEYEATANSEAKEAAWEICKDLAKQPNILELVAKLIEKAGAVGVERIVKLLILILTSRVLERPVSVAVKGSSSAGKSFFIEQTLRAFPKDSYYLLTAMSERALAYSDEPLKNRFLVLIEAGGAGEMANYLIRSLLSEGKLSYETVEKSADGLKARLIEREGPTGLLVTTTRTGLHPENETRMFSLTVSDTKEQTRLILDAIAVDRPPVDFDEARALQEWIGLSDNRVIIPFAETLAAAVEPVAVRLRRDFSAVLNLIRAHAILHQASRKRDREGRIIATLDDYAAVRELVADLVAEGVEATVAPMVRETVKAVEDLTKEFDHADGVTAKAVGDKLELDKAPASRRCRKAQELGYLQNHEERKGKAGRYVIGDPMPDDVEILPTVEDLQG